MSVPEQSIDDRMTGFLASALGDAPPPQEEANADAPEAQETPVDAAPDAEEAPEAAAPSDDAGEQVEAAESEPGEEPAADSEGDEGDYVEISTGAEFAKALADHGLEIDEAQLYAVQFPVRMPDGTDKLMSVGEMKDATAASQRALAERETFEAEQAKARDEITQRQQAVTDYEAQLTAGLKYVHNNLAAEGQQIEALRHEDPAEFAARAQEWQVKVQAFERYKQDAITASNAAKLQAQAQDDAQRAELLIQERNALLSAKPELADPEKFRAFDTHVSGYLQKQGFAPEVIASISDHRLLLVAEKARLYDEQVATAKDTVRGKKGIKIGTKVIKPGRTQTRADKSANQRDAQRARLKKTGRAEDAAPLLGPKIERMLGG